MTTHHKTRTGGHRARLGPVGHGFSHDINPVRSAFLSRCPSRESSILGFRLCFGCPGPFFAPARRSSVFAFLSQKAPKSAKNYSTLHAERSTRQVIENNQSRYALLDTLRGSSSERNRETNINENPPCAQRKDGVLRKAVATTKSRSLVAVLLRMTTKSNGNGEERFLIASLCRNDNEKQSRRALRNDNERLRGSREWLVARDNWRR
jgi:hypothetical protein